MKFQYPLQWPPQQPRTKRPERSRFGPHSLSYMGKYIENELRLLNAKDCIVSTNLKTKVMGGFYASQRVEDAGVTIFFKLKNKDKTMACDKWDTPEDNLWALYLSLSAIRGLERWGGSEFLDGLFTGFKALPSPDDQINIPKQYFNNVDNLEHLQLKFKQLAKTLHPDSETGNQEDFQEMMTQYKQMRLTLAVI